MSRSERHRQKKNSINFVRLGIFILLCVLIIAALIFGLKSCSKKKDINYTPKDNNEETQGGENNTPDVSSGSAIEQPKDPKADWPNTTTPDSAYPLTKPDDDILVLVNKTHSVEKSYEADDLVTVEHCDKNIGNNKTKMMRKVAADAFEELHAGALADGYNILMRTGYRSYDYQTSLFNSYASKHGEKEADTYSARPGKSEHQTGLACDVGLQDKNGNSYSLTSFDNKPEAKWIAENCWKYGFILRYPADKIDITGYIYESWHIRYVGLEAAKIIYENNWTLEEYLETIADYR